MPGPWERYSNANQGPETEPGPWSKYAAPAASPVTWETSTPKQRERAKHSATGREAGKKPLSADVADLIEGTGKVTASNPALLPAAAILAPVPTALGVAGAYGGSKLSARGAKALGAGPEGQRLAGDVGGIAGGVAGGVAGAKLLPALGSALKSWYDSKTDTQTFHVDQPEVKPTAPKVQAEDGYRSRGSDREQYLRQLPSPAPKQRVNASETADAGKKIADSLRQSGMTAEHLKSVTPEHWKQVAQQMGVEAPDEATLKVVAQELSKPVGPVKVRRRQAGR